MTKAKPKKSDNERAVSARILLGLLAGVIIGVGFQAWGKNPTGAWLLTYVIDPVGQAFLRALFLIVVPLVFSSLVVGVAGLGSINNVGRLGGRLGAYYIATTAIAIFIGQFLVSVFKPGAGVSAEYLAQARGGLANQVAGLVEKSAHVNESLWPGLVSAIIPKNILAAMVGGEMLAIIFVAILLGVALLKVPSKQAESFLSVLDAISQASIVIVGWIMKLAPYAVGALMIGAVARFGVDVMGNVAKYVGVVLLGYCVHFFGTYSLILRFLMGISPVAFFRLALPAIATAFSTSSSNATIPTTIKTLEENFGVSPEITTFSIPLGATVNMDGTALFEMIAALFVAQVFGVEISAMGQATLVLLVLLTSVGVAGVPGGSIPILMSAMATMGIPPEGIALVLGVDRLLDMGRTMLNVTGDMTAALYLDGIEDPKRARPYRSGFVLAST